MISSHRPKKKTVDAHNAQQRIQDGMARGDIKKPDSCSKCGKKGPVEFAHSDYSGKANGRWLCRSCHRKGDGKSPKGGGSGSAGTTRAS